MDTFSNSFYNLYLEVADPYSRRIIAKIIQENLEYINPGQEWLKDNLDNCKKELITVNKSNFPIIFSKTEEISEDLALLGIEKQDLLQEFISIYQELLVEMGFTTRDVARITAAFHLDE